MESDPGPSPRPKRFAKPLIVVSGALGVLLLASGLVLVKRPLPAREGIWAVPGLSAPVDVSFDAAGIPHIRAATSSDAWCALGWLHANDRFFQMELRRRAAAGRLAEVFGSAALSLDKDSRRNGFMHRAEADAASLPRAELDVIDAYAAGVNAYLGERPLPLELLALGIDPEPWKRTDSLAFGWQLYASLTDSGVREYRLAQALRAHGADVVSMVLRASGEDVEDIPEELSRLTLPAGQSPTPDHDLPRAASNAWAVSGERSASGTPLLASDPHLWVDYPAIWYVAHLSSSDGLHVAGLTLAGVPGVVIGHNGRVAWGITMQQADDTDLFLEDLDPVELTTREPDGRFAPVSLREETIRVRGEEPQTETVLETPRGTLFLEDRGRIAWSRSWAAGSTDHALSAFLDFDRASDGSELARAAERYTGPPVNIVWADASGRIGMRTAGSIPVRSSGSGRLPGPAWTGTHRWLGRIPADELPSLDDPPEGFVASGNDDWSASGETLPYPGHFASSLRVLRIREVLASTRLATLDDFRALQNDLLSPYALRVAAGLRDLRETGGDTSRAVDILLDWDGSVEKRGPAALFYPFLAEARRALFAARESREGVALPANWETLATLIEGRGPQVLWDDPETETLETRESVLSEALASSLVSLEAEEGSDPRKWNWGRRHRLEVRHPFSTRLRWLGWLVNPSPIEMPGEWHNPRVAGFGLSRGDADVRHIASARLLVDIGNPDHSRVVLPLGQSAHLGDVHRLDHLPVWTDGRDFPLPFTAEAVEQAAVSSLRLVPPVPPAQLGKR
jgi:penicillin amidase